MLVTLLGAGPGDPELLTLRGKAALEKCDVVVYDALANSGFLDYVPENAEKIYAGKIADQHALPQDAINALLVDKARENGGQRVVRLKGGDPFIFGRGGEEVLFLKKAGIPFEIIPGITSAIAVPTYAGIPLTHRGYTSSLTILTGHENPEKESSSINWSAVAKSNSTLVFVMGMKNLSKIVERLMVNGMDGSMPAAVIYRGTTPFQKTFTGALEKLPELTEHAGVSNPAIIVIGKVVELASELEWYSKKPLLGKTVVVTRAREQASGIRKELSERGANVIQFPVIKVKPLSDYTLCDMAINQLEEYGWIIFTSVNGVKFFWNRLEKAGLDSRSLGKSKIAAIGPATVEALKSHGIHPDFMPDSYVAEKVAEGIIERAGDSLKSCKVLLPRALEARNVLPDMLADKGAIIDVCPVYETVPEKGSREEILSYLKNKCIDCISFGSSSTVHNFFGLIPANILLEHSEVSLAAIGPITARTLQEYGLNCDIMPGEYDIPGLVNAITGYFSNLRTSQ